MQAFKAANPGCSLADFARWTTRGQASAFFSSEATLDGVSLRGSGGEHDPWTELWGEALPIPASDQAPLFDPRQVANGLIADLSKTKRSVRLREAAVLAASRLAGELSTLEPAWAEPRATLIKGLLDAARWRGNSTGLEVLVSACAEAEAACMSVASLRYKIGCCGDDGKNGDMVGNLAVELARRLMRRGTLHGERDGGDDDGGNDDGDPFGPMDPDGDGSTPAVSTGWVPASAERVTKIVGNRAGQTEAADVRVYTLSPHAAVSSAGPGTRLYARVDGSGDGATLRLALAKRCPSEPMP